MQQLTVQDMFQHNREKWLEQARHEAKKLLARRPSITIEDVLAVCPRPTYINRNTTGAVFDKAHFTAIGIERSKRPVSKGRWIFKWALKENT